MDLRARLNRRIEVLPEHGRVQLSLTNDKVHPTESQNNRASHHSSSTAIISFYFLKRKNVTIVHDHSI